ncbi:MAG: efflux RND transporter permease subunit, partial [Desulfobacteraceae bacterium]
MNAPERHSHDHRSAKGPITWMAGHSVTANLLMLVLLVGGLMMGLQIKKEVFPDFELDRVTIQVAYPGASPEEVESGIILAIEEAVQDIQGIEEIVATANEGSAMLTVEVLEGEDTQQVARDIKNAVDRITSFPEEAEEPTVVVAKRNRYVVSLALFGDQSESVLREMAEIVRDRLLQDPQISQVDLVGVRDHEISIEIPQATLRAYDLTLTSVAQTLRQAAAEVPGGAIKTDAGDILLRVKERRNVALEFGKIPVIASNDGTQVFLEQIAEIRDGFEESDRYVTFNGQPAVMLEVYRVGDQTPTSV